MTVIATNKLAAVDFVAPRLDPVQGVLAAVDWQQTTGPSRFLDSGVLVQRTNFDGDTGYAEWNEAWNATAQAVSQTKEGDRPDRDDTPFIATTAYAYAKNPCGDLRAVTREETVERSQALLARSYHRTVATKLAARFAADITAESIPAQAAADVIAAISNLEASIADAEVNFAYIHLAPKHAAALVAARLVQLRADGWHTPLNHLLVFDSGYAGTLGQKLVATTQLYGWKSPVADYAEITHSTNEFISIHEQSTLLAYEQVLAQTTLP